MEKLEVLYLTANIIPSGMHILLSKAAVPHITPQDILRDLLLSFQTAHNNALQHSITSS